MPEQAPSANSLLICYICNLDWAASGLLWAQKKGLPGTLDCFSDPGFPGAGGRTAGKIQSFKLKSRKGHVTRYEERKHSTVSVCLELSFLSASLKRGIIASGVEHPQAVKEVWLSPHLPAGSGSFAARLVRTEQGPLLVLMQASWASSMSSASSAQRM